MKNVEYLIFSIDSLKCSIRYPYRGKIIKCLRAFGEEESDTIRLCEFTGNKFIPILNVEIKKIENQIVIEIFLQTRDKYNKLEEVLRRHHVKGNYLHSLQHSFAFVLKKIDEIEI